MTTPILPPAGVPFGALAAELSSHPWRHDVEVQPMAAPQRIASDSAAIEAQVVAGGRDLAGGRLVLLHEPRGNEAWQGSLRLVSFCRAQVTAGTAADPHFAEVAWRWITDALDDRGAEHVALAGTVTTVASRGFGDLAADEAVAEVELRASWTPVLPPHDGLARHLAAWQDLLCWVAGTPELPEGVVPLGTRMGRGR